MLNRLTKNLQWRLSEWLSGDVKRSITQIRTHELFEHDRIRHKITDIDEQLYRIEQRLRVTENAMKMVSLESAYKAVREAGEKI